MPPRLKRRVTGADRKAKKKVKARGVMERMRRRQRFFLVLLASALLVPFGAYGIVQQLLASRRREAAGTAYGEKVSAEVFWGVRRRMLLALDIIRQRLGGPSTPALADEEVWDRFVLLHEARALGLEVSPDEVNSLLAMLFPDAEGAFSRQAFEAYLERWRGIKEAEVREAVADDVLVGGPLTSFRLLVAQFQLRQRVPPAERLRLGPKLHRHLTATLQVTDDEVWAFFLDAQRSYEVAYIALSADDFLQDVPTPTEEQRGDWFEKHKDRNADESDDGVGYFLPERCRVHYFLARKDDFKQTVTVSRTELEDYYEKNKARFRVTTRPTTGPASRPSTRPTTAPTTRVAVPTRPASRPATGPTTTRALEFRPFEEVEGEVRDLLIDEKARKAAADAAKNAGNARVRLEDDFRDEPEAIDYNALAKRYRMTYTPSKGEVTAGQAVAIEGLKEARNQLGKTIDRIFFGDLTFEDADLVDPDGNAYHVWRTDKRRERAQTYEEVRGQVERDVKAFQAYERAGARAEELLAALAELPPGTEAPLAALAKKHPGLAVETTEPFFLGAEELAPRRAEPGADEDARRSVRRGVFARLIRREDLPPGRAAVVGDRIARVQYLLRVTKRTDPHLDDFRAARYVYRLMALEQKRDRFLTAWLEVVKERANVQPTKPEEDKRKKEPEAEEP